MAGGFLATASLRHLCVRTILASASGFPATADLRHLMAGTVLA